MTQGICRRPERDPGCWALVRNGTAGTTRLPSAQRCRLPNGWWWLLRSAGLLMLVVMAPRMFGWGLRLMVIGVELRVGQALSSQITLDFLLRRVLVSPANDVLSVPFVSTMPPWLVVCSKTKSPNGLSTLTFKKALCFHGVTLMSFQGYTVDL